TIDTGEDVTSGAISATATAADVEAALAALPNIGKTGTVDNVAVAQFGTSYLVGFVGPPFAAPNANVPALMVADQSHLLAQDQEQTFQVLNATGGSFTLSFALDVNGNGTIEDTETQTTGPILYPATADDVKAALENVTVQSGTNMVALKNNISVSQVGTSYTVALHLRGPV